MKRNRARFTLIELIVIVSIIGILTSLLMSVMQASMEKAKDISCKENLKNLGQSIFSFVDDNNRDMPEPSGGAPREMNYFVWDLAPYLGYEDIVYDPVKKTPLGEYSWYRNESPVPDVFQCALREANGYISYGWNYWHIHGWGTRNNYPNHNSQWHRIKFGRVVDNNSKDEDKSYISDVPNQVVMGDSEKMERGSELMGRRNAAPYISTRHVGDNNELGGNYLFLDGRVQWRAKSYLITNRSQGEFWTAKP